MLVQLYDFYPHEVVSIDSREVQMAWTETEGDWRYLHLYMKDGTLHMVDFTMATEMGFVDEIKDKMEE